MFVFSIYLPIFLLKFRSGELVGCGIKFRIQRVPKNKKYLEKNVMMMSSSHFSGISYFWGSGVYQKYAVCILIGCGIKFYIQRALPLIIWVKTQEDMSKIQTKKIVFFYDKYVKSTIVVDPFYWNSIGSWIPTHKNLLLARFIIRPILDPKFPLMYQLFS